MARKNFFKGLGLALLAVVLLALGACGMAPAGNSTVTFLLSEGMAKAIMPEHSLTCDHYSLAGTGTSGQALGSTFDLDVDAGVAAASLELLPGGWSVEVTVWNDDTTSLAVGSGAASFTVTVGSPLTVPIHCLPYVGPGTLTAAISWVPDVVASPAVTIDAKSFGGTVFPMSVTVDTSTSASGTLSLEQGWYTGFLQIFDAGVLNAGIAKTIRIAKDWTTAWSEYLTVNMLSGEINIDLDYYAGSPLVLTTNPAEGSVPVYEGVDTVFAVTGADFDGGQSGVYSWYINGDPVSLSATNSFTAHGSDYTPGLSYYLSGVVHQSDGRRMGDCQFIITPTEFNPDAFIASWNGTAGVSYYVEIWNVSSGLKLASSAAIPCAVTGEMLGSVVYGVDGSNYNLCVREVDGQPHEYWPEAQYNGSGTLIASPQPAPIVYAMGDLSFTTE